MPDKAPQVHDVSIQETRIISVDFSGKLDSGELLTGTPVVTEYLGSDLTFTSEQVNAAALTINGTSIAAGLAVQFKCAATNAVPGDRYAVDITCATDAGQTVAGTIEILATR